MFVEKVSEPPVFQPIRIVLVTQEEVDKFYAILNYSPFVDTLQLNGWQVKLQPYRTENYGNYYEKLIERLGKK